MEYPPQRPEPAAPGPTPPQAGQAGAVVPAQAAPQGTAGTNAANDDEDALSNEALSARRRGSIPSFIFMSFLLFMLTNGNTESFLARTQYQDALDSLEWQMGNYSAWLNGTETNFTMVSKCLRLQTVRPR